MASDFQKPDRTHTLFSFEIQDKMWQLPVSSLFMCGASSVQTLHKLGILTIGELATADPEILEAHLKSHGRLLWEYANGIDDSPVISEPAKAKGIGNSITLASDVLTTQEAHCTLLSLAESVAARLRMEGQCAMMESVEIKYADFHSVSHQTTLSVPTNSSSMLYETACQLFDELWNHAPIRLLGIRTTKLSSENELMPIQLSLFDTAPVQNEKQQRLDRAVDSIRQKFGKDAIVRGSLLGKQDTFRKH